MGRDDSPRERQRKELARKLARHASYDRILIVSEGRKTEPNYFSEIRSFYRLHAANVRVRPSELGTQPIQVVRYARDLFEKGDAHRRILSKAFEQVYAVFDRDDHATYHEALKLAESLDGKLRNDLKQHVSFKAIASVPSFELWLLLHFEDIQAPLHRDTVLDRLKQHIPDYEKGSCDTFTTTQPRLDQAMDRAARLAAKFTAYSEPEPYTGVADLVSLLTNLKI